MGSNIDEFKKLYKIGFQNHGGDSRWYTDDSFDYGYVFCLRDDSTLAKVLSVVALHELYGDYLLDVFEYDNHIVFKVKKLKTITNLTFYEDGKKKKSSELHLGTYSSVRFAIANHVENTLVELEEFIARLCDKYEIRVSQYDYHEGNYGLFQSGNMKKWICFDPVYSYNVCLEDGEAAITAIIKSVLKDFGFSIQG